MFETNCSALTCQELDALFKQSTCRISDPFDISPWNLIRRNVVEPSLPFLGIANSILSLRLSTNKDMADSLANLDLGGLAEGVPDEAVVVPLTELDMVGFVVVERAKSDRSTVYRRFRGDSWVLGTLV